MNGRRVSVAEIYAAAQSLQAAYVAAFPLTQITISAQKLKSGDIVLSVVDGYFEALDLSSVPERARNLVRERLTPLLNNKRLTTAEFQRRIMIVGAINGLQGGSSSRPGSKTGAQILVMTASEALISSAAAIDNRLPKEFGTWQFSKAAGLNNALGLGEQLSFNVASGRDFDNFFSGTSLYEAYGGNLTVPIGNDGLTFNGGYVAVRTRPLSNPNTFSVAAEIAGERVKSRFERTSANLVYPIYVRVDKTLRAQATYEYTDQRVSIGPIPWSLGIETGALFDAYRDRYSAARLGVEGNSVLPWGLQGRVSGTSTYSHGFSGRADGGGRIGSIPLSRSGASGDFDKLSVKLGLMLVLPEEIQFSFVGRAQTTFGKPVVITEKMSLSTADGVSGYALGSLNVDTGLTLRTEIGRSFHNLNLFAANSAATPYIFGAWGRGSQAWPMLVSANLYEPKVIQAATVGGGVRTNTNFTGNPLAESLNVEFGRDFSNIPYRENGYRTNLVWNLAYSGAPARPSLSFDKDDGESISEHERRSAPLWTGFYAGLNAGYAWGASQSVSTAGVVSNNALDNVLLGPYSNIAALSASGQPNVTTGGYIGGGQFGYNLQFNRILVGLETDMQGMGVRGSKLTTQLAATSSDFTNDLDTVASFAQAEKSVDWLGTMRGRLGYTITPTLAAYATGGVAFGKAEASVDISQMWSGVLGAYLNSPGAMGRFSGMKTGYTYGGGLEWMFAPNMTLKGEYLYYNIGGATFLSSPSLTLPSANNLPAYENANGFVARSRVTFDGYIARLGVNYHFGEQMRSLPGKSVSKTTWTGFYGGLNAGYLGDLSSGVSTTGIPILAGLDEFGPLNATSVAGVTGRASARSNGMIGGGQAGFNYQFRKFLAGVETDIQGATAKGNGGFVGNVGFASQDGISQTTQTFIRNAKAVNWLGTLRTRLGFLATPDLLGYATAGLAYGGVAANTYVSQQSGGEIGQFLQNSASFGGFSDSRIGWTAGAGVEWMCANDISVKGEYLYYDLGSASFAATPLTQNLFSVDSRLLSAITPSSQLHFGGQMMRMGMNYHFSSENAHTEESE